MSASTLHILFIMDPIEGILIDQDTTFVLMLEAQARGHRIFYSRTEWMGCRDSRPLARLHPLEVRREPGNHFSLGTATTRLLDEMDVIFVRKDPPLDLQYLHATHLLSLIDEDRTLIINSPRGLRQANEHLYILNFPDLIPETLVTCSISELKAFLKEVGGAMVVKPVDGHGGEGVLVLRADDRNLIALLEMSTDFERKFLIAQRYLPEIARGDQRVIVLDGEPIGAVNRIPPPDDHRGNVHVGGRCERWEVDDQVRRICDEMAPRLRADGLPFVGLDVIGGYLTEVNVTSPTCVQEINALDHARLESQIIDFAERWMRSLRRG